MRFVLLTAALIAAPPAFGQTTFDTSAGKVAVTTLTEHLVHPWSLAFLPDGRMLVTERPGRMRIVTKDGKASQPIAGVPKVYARCRRA
jgi:aldose sugar dehydrogenase